MTEFIAGPTMVLTWTCSIGTAAAGTTTLAADYRTCSWNPSIAYVDASAGADTQMGRLTALKDATASITLVSQTGGTALGAVLQPGQAGTLIIKPEGTASGKRTITFPAYSDGAVTDWPYADVAVISCGFTGSSVLGNFTDV
jgi:hypothetical protein